MKFNRVTLAALGFACLSSGAMALDPYIVPDIHTDKIVGTWKCRIGNMRHTITFVQDGSFKGVYRVGNEIADEYEGTWIIKQAGYLVETYLNYSYTKSKLLAPGTKNSDYVERLNDKALWVITKNGRNDTRRIWTRVEEKK